MAASRSQGVRDETTTGSWVSKGTGKKVPTRSPTHPIRFLFFVPPPHPSRLPVRPVGPGFGDDVSSLSVTPLESLTDLQTRSQRGESGGTGQVKVLFPDTSRPPFHLDRLNRRLSRVG